ncbi:hypothetical protein FKM82_013881 [Ascaphus truei]
MSVRVVVSVCQCSGVQRVESSVGKPGPRKPEVSKVVCVAGLTGIPESRVDQDKQGSKPGKSKIAQEQETQERRESTA